MNRMKLKMIEIEIEIEINGTMLMTTEDNYILTFAQKRTNFEVGSKTFSHHFGYEN